jgi:phytoene dehydrogenase-like protein
MMSNSIHKNSSFDSSYDVVVIGAGLGGLGAALNLALTQKRVLLLEQHNLPGGFASSFVRGRFEFEISLHEMCAVGPPEGPFKGPIRYVLQDESGVDVEFVPVPEAYQLVLTDEEHKINVKLPFGVENFINAVCSAVPETPRDKLVKYFDLCRECNEGLTFVARSKGKIDYKTLMSKYLSFLTTSGYSAAEVTNKFGFPRKTLDLLYPYSVYLGLPMSRLDFTIWASLLHLYINQGAWIPKGTSHQMCAAIDSRIRELGGQTEYNTKVKSILVKERKIIGVETDTGEKIKTNYVITNISPHLVYGQLISPANAVPEEAYKLNNSRGLGVSAFVVYMGLDSSPKELNLDSYSYFISSNMDTEKINESMLQNKNMPDFTASICLNNAIPDCSPPGTTIFSITSAFGIDVWKNITPEIYFTTKNKIARQMIEQVSKALNTPIFDHIEEIEIATPQTFSRYTGSFKGGVYGYDLDPWDSIVIRSQVQAKEKFFKGLEFAGGFGSMGHGYNSSLLSGRQAARTVLYQMKKSGG